jgi:hypothetical protein
MIVLMGMAAAIAVISFSTIARHLFDHGLADRHAQAPDIRIFYKTYIAHTKNKTGRIGGVFWVHIVSAGVFIFAGVAYTIYRFILPRIF